MSERANPDMWAFPTANDFNLQDSVHRWVLDLLQLRTTLDERFKAICDLLANNVNLVHMQQQAVLTMWAQMQAQTTDMYFKMTRDNYFVQAMPTNQPPIDPEQAIGMIDLADLATIPTENISPSSKRERELDEFLEEHAAQRQRVTH